MKVYLQYGLEKLEESNSGLMGVFWETIPNQYDKQYLICILVDESVYESKNVCFGFWRMSQGA